MATEYQADATAALYLDRHGFDARSFVVQTYHTPLGKRPASIAVEPAFPGYLLVRLHPDDDRQHLRADSRHGIAGLLTAVGSQRPATLGDAAMAALLRLTDLNRHAGEHLLGRIDEAGRLRPIPRPHEAQPDLTDEDLEIADHPYLAGFRGRCLRSGAERVVLLLRVLGGEREVTVARSAVRRA